jgi:hypothetical protein
MPTQDLAGILQELSTLSAFLQRNADPSNIDTSTSGKLSSGWHDTLLSHHGIEAASSPRPDNNVHSTSTEDRLAQIYACMELLQRSIDIGSTQGRNSQEAIAAFVKGQAAFEACMKKTFETAPVSWHGSFTTTPSPTLPIFLRGNSSPPQATSNFTALPAAQAKSMVANNGTSTPQLHAKQVRACSVESNSSTSSSADSRRGMGLVLQQADHCVDVANKLQQVTPSFDAAITHHQDDLIRDLIGKIVRGYGIGSQPGQFSSPFVDMRVENQAKRRKGSDGGVKGDSLSSKAWEAKCSSNERDESDDSSSLSSQHSGWSRTTMNPAENSVESSDDSSSSKGMSIDGSASRGSPANTQNYNSKPSVYQCSFHSFLAKMESAGVITRQMQKKEGAPDLAVGFTVVEGKLDDWKELRKEWFMAGKVGQVYRPSSLHQMLRRRGFYPTMKTHRTSHGHDFENSMSYVIDETSQRRYNQSKTSPSPAVAEERRRATKRRMSPDDK